MILPEKKVKESKKDKKSNKQKDKVTGKENVSSLTDSEDQRKEKGQVVNEMINQGFPFIPDVMFENIVDNYDQAVETYGETIIRIVSGYSPGYIKKNINIPEFQRELKKRLDEKKKELKDVQNGNKFKEEYIEVAAKVLIVEELSKFKNLLNKDFSKENINRTGQVTGTIPYKVKKKSDINIRKTLRRAIGRNKRKLDSNDLLVNERKSDEKPNVVYAIDSSSSMKGFKMHAAKKAAVALSYKTINDKGKISLLSFSSESSVLTGFLEDFFYFTKKLTEVKPRGETNIANAIKESINQFRDKKNKILFLITDFEPTSGKKPVDEAIKAASHLRDSNIKLVLVGINLNGDGKEVAEKIAEVSEGEFTLLNTKALNELDVILLEKYSKFIN
ncbi:MAG: vWA domain-containing protein [Candidatus Woesearchaeota archaeon]